MELSEVHLFVIGLLAPIIIWGVKTWQERSGKPVPSGVLTAGVYVVSFGLGLLFGAPILPAFGPFSDPVSFVGACLQWLGDFLIAVGPLVGFATLVYNALLKRVLDGLEAKLLPPRIGVG